MKRLTPKNRLALMNKLTHRIVAALFTLLIGISMASSASAQSAANPNSANPNNSELESNSSAVALRIKQIEMVWRASLAEMERSKAERDKLNLNLLESNVSEVSYSDVLRLLQTQRVELMIDLAGLEARKGLMEELAAEAAVDPAATGNFEIAELTGEMVETMKQKVDAIASLYEQGIGSAGDVANAKLLLAEAKIKLAKARIPATPVSQLRLDHTEVALEKAEKRARLIEIESILNKHYQARPEVDRIKEIEAAYSMHFERHLELHSKLEDLKIEASLNYID